MLLLMTTILCYLMKMLYILIYFLAVIFSFLALILPFLQNANARSKAIKEENYLRKKLLKHLFDLGRPAFLNLKTGAMMSTIVDGSEKVSFYLQTFFGQVFASFSVPFFTIVLIAIFIDPICGVVLLLCIPLIPLIVGLARKSFFVVFLLNLAMLGFV